MLSLVYEELRVLAQRQLKRGRPGQTLDTTALVHEVYLKLGQAERADWKDRQHLLAVAARAMRQLVLDAVRGKAAAKRGAGAPHLQIDELQIGEGENTVNIIALDQALTRIGELSPRLEQTVELRFLAGLSTEEIAEALGVSERTVRNDWRKARALLHSALSESGSMR